MKAPRSSRLAGWCRLQELLRLRGEERERPGRELLGLEAQGVRRQAVVRPPLDEALEDSTYRPSPT